MEPPRMTDAPGGAGRRQVGLRRRGVAPGPSGGEPGRCAGIQGRPAAPRQPKEEDVPSLRREGREEGCSAFFFLFSPGWLSRRRSGWKKSELLLLLLFFLRVTSSSPGRTGRERVCVFGGGRFHFFLFFRKLPLFLFNLLPMLRCRRRPRARGEVS